MTTTALVIGLNLLGVGLHQAGLPLEVDVGGIALLAAGLWLGMGRIEAPAVSGRG